MKQGKTVETHYIFELKILYNGLFFELFQKYVDFLVFRLALFWISGTLLQASDSTARDGRQVDWIFRTLYRKVWGKP